MTRFDPSGIEAVLLDAGNTLVFLDLERILPAFRDAGARVDLEGLHSAERAARRTLHRHLTEGSTGLEMEAWRAYFMDLMARVGVSQNELPRVAERLRAIHRERHLWTRVEPTTRDALHRLRGVGYRLAVISNADGRIEGTLEEVGLRDLFEFVLDSEVVGLEKPDPAIYLEGARRMGLDPRRCVYVGDLVAVDVRGAVRAGMEAVLVDPGDALSEAGVPRVASVGELPSLLKGRLANLEDP